MSDTILSGDITVFYLDENRRKQVRWSGAGADSRSVNEMYSAMENLMDEPTQSNDGSIMSAETPVEYTTGIIDAKDLEPWYMSYDLMQHLTGSAIRTAGWARVLPGDGTGNIGFVVVAVTGNSIDDSDVGDTITNTIAGDTGTLMEVIEAGATDYLVIRPLDNELANDWDTAANTIDMTGSANSATQAAAGVTGEQIWANLYNVTPIEADTHVYMYQGLVDDASRARIQNIDNTAGDWWPEGAFDRLFIMNDFKLANFPVIDAGFITALARKGNTTYDSFEVLTSLVSGGRNPVPLKSAPDANHTTGYLSIVEATDNTDDWTVGDEFEGQSSGARGVITLITGASPDRVFHYYQIGDPQLAFTTAEQVLNNDGTGDMVLTAAGPQDQGPGLSTFFTSNSFPTIVHANTTFDFDDDATAEGYGILIDCNANPLGEVYEWLQHITRNGETGTTPTDGIEGEQYQGPTVYLTYSGVPSGGTLDEGNDVTQETSGATGIIVSHDTTLKQILLRDTRGVFATDATTHTLTDNVSSATVEIDTLAENFAANTGTPFGSLAGGVFFGARGVLITDFLAADENNSQLRDSANVLRLRPVTFLLEITNLVGAAETETDSDLVLAARLTGVDGAIDKTEFSAAGGETTGGTSLVVDTVIPADVPGKSGGGVLYIRDQSDVNREYRIRYTSYVTSTFTLFQVAVAAADAGTNTTTVVEAGAFGSVLRGDIVINEGNGHDGISYVTDVPDANTINIDPPITGQTTGDVIEVGGIPVAVVNTLDDVFVSLLDLYATGAVAQVSIQFLATLDWRIRVRNKRNASPIKTFVADVQAASAIDRSTPVTRLPDTIFVA